MCHEFNLNIPDCEDIWVQIELEHGKCLIGVIYRHPKQNLNRFHLSFEKVLELLSCKNVTYYIGGDFNINLLQNENKVKAYIDMTYSLGAIPLITHPTRVTDNSSSLLDHVVYTNNISGETHSYILLDDISDHMPVIVWSDSALQHPKKYKANYVRDTKNFEAKLFLEGLSKSLHLLGETNLPININEIDIYTDKFINIFQLLLDKHAPLRKRSRKELKLKTKPWIRKGLRKSTHRKNCMHKKCVNSKCTAKWDEYKMYRNKLTHLKNSAKKLYYQDIIRKNKQNTAKL